VASQFIAPIVAWLVGVLRNIQWTEGLAPFAQVTQSWTGVVINWPPAAVMPRTSGFDPEISAGSHSENLLTVKFGVNGPDPDQVAADAMSYMLAVDAAIEAAPRLPQISRVFVQAHDYGPLYEKDGGFAKFPELHLVVEVYE
jgi:hypothetical protein